MFSKTRPTYDPLPLPDRVSLSDDAALEAAQSFLANMRRRHSVRDFLDRTVPVGVIKTCIRAAGTAPSGATHQPWVFTAVADPNLKARNRAAA